ncbi:hypothetical protein E2320_020397, partial [Naja naja]
KFQLFVIENLLGCYIKRRNMKQNFLTLQFLLSASREKGSVDIHKTKHNFTYYAHTMTGYISKIISRVCNTIPAKCLNYNIYNACYEQDAWSC